MVILEAPEWSPIRQVNFVASLDKMAADQTKKRYPEIEVPNERPFKCLSFARKSFVYFLDLDRVLYLHADRSRSYQFILSKASLSMNSPLRGEIQPFRYLEESISCVWMVKLIKFVFK